LSRTDNILRSAAVHLVALLVAGAVHVLPGTGRAESVSLSAQFDHFVSGSETENKITLDETESDSTVFRQRYNLNLSRQIYPYLVFTGGGSFKVEDTDLELEGVSSDSRRTTLRPYLELKITNPFMSTGIGYQNAKDRRKSSGTETVTDTTDTYYTFLSLRPDPWPELDLKYSRINRTDDPRTKDRVEDLFNLHSRYPFEGGSLDYNFSHNRNEDRLGDFRTTVKSHSGKFQHARSYANGKVNVSTGYRISHLETDLKGTGSSLIPQLRFAGLFSLDNSPEDGPALSSIGGLLDGNLDVPTSIDIGLAGDETIYSNVGLDLGFTVPVDTIRVWVDRELTQEVSDSFTWFVYTSPDNTDSSEWQLHATVPAADFGALENRFEIIFPETQTRFIKIAVIPLLSSVPGSSVFPNIFLTEMEVFTTLTSEDEYRTTGHNLNHNMNWKISDRTTVGYDWFMRNQRFHPAGTETTSMTSGAYWNHRYNDVFTGSGRISRETRAEGGENSARNSYSASLRANYIRAFRQILTFSGSRTFGSQDDSRRDSLFLRNSADLYSGWSANLDMGLNWSSTEGESKTRGHLLRVGTKVTPNEIITLNLDYTANRTHSSGEEEGNLKETGSFQAFILPSRTISLFSRLQYEEDDESSSTYQNHNINWSPLSGGTVQFFLSYNQRFFSEDDRDETVFSPGLKWRVTRYATFRTTYDLYESDSDSEHRKSRNLTASLKLNL
jgi:hypothetical protein